MTPIEPGSPSSTATTSAMRPRRSAGATATRSSRPGLSRTDTGDPRPGAMCGSSCAAYSMTLAGTRKPRSSTSTWLPGLPRWCSEDSHESVAHGVVPWAMSPSTVAGPGRAPPPDGAQLHGGQVLRLVEDDVAQGRGAGDVVAELVEQDRVGPRPARPFPWSEAGCPTSRIRRSSSLRRPCACRASVVGIGEQREQHGLGVERRPQARDVLLHDGAAGHLVLHPVVGGVAGPLHLQQDRVGQPLRQHLPGRVVAHPPRLAARRGCRSTS